MKIGKYIINFRAYKISEFIYGLGSAVDGHHVLFMDLDNYEIENTIRQLKEIQKKYLLSDIYVFESSKNNYHAISLDKLKFGTIIDIHRELGTDIRHDIESLKKGQWFLRASKKNDKPKPKYYTTIKSKKPDYYEKSNAHRLFLQSNYKIKIAKNYYSYDNYKSLLVNKYNALLKII